MEKVHDNRFAIKTSKPGVEVSWQVTGIRHDAYANAHRIPVEEVKSLEEQGHYLHPELFGTGAEKTSASAAAAPASGMVAFTVKLADPIRVTNCPNTTDSCGTRDSHSASLHSRNHRTSCKRTALNLTVIAVTPSFAPSGDDLIQ
jgi:hypothetical protein